MTQDSSKFDLQQFFYNKNLTISIFDKASFCQYTFVY